MNLLIVLKDLTPDYYDEVKSSNFLSARAIPNNPKMFLRKKYEKHTKESINVYSALLYITILLRNMYTFFYVHISLCKLGTYIIGTFSNLCN